MPPPFLKSTPALGPGGFSSPVSLSLCHNLKLCSSAVQRARKKRLFITQVRLSRHGLCPMTKRGSADVPPYRDRSGSFWALYLPGYLGLHCVFGTSYCSHTILLYVRLCTKKQQTCGHNLCVLSFLLRRFPPEEEAGSWTPAAPAWCAPPPSRLSQCQRLIAAPSHCSSLDEGRGGMRRGKSSQPDVTYFLVYNNKSHSPEPG